MGGNVCGGGGTNTYIQLCIELAFTNRKSRVSRPGFSRVLKVQRWCAPCTVVCLQKNLTFLRIAILRSVFTTVDFPPWCWFLKSENFFISSVQNAASAAMQWTWVGLASYPSLGFTASFWKDSRGKQQAMPKHSMFNIESLGSVTHIPWVLAPLSQSCFSLQNWKKAKLIHKN